MKGEWWWQLWTILQERDEGIIILCLPTIIYLYVYKSVCVQAHMCYTYTRTHKTRHEKLSFKLLFSKFKQLPKTIQCIVVELSCFPGSEVSSFFAENPMDSGAGSVPEACSLQTRLHSTGKCYATCHGRKAIKSPAQLRHL